MGIDGSRQERACLNGGFYEGTYLCGPLFTDCQNFVGSWGQNFVGNCFVPLQCKRINYFVKILWGRKFMGKGNPGVPHKQDDPAVFRGKLHCTSWDRNLSTCMNILTVYLIGEITWVSNLWEWCVWYVIHVFHLSWKK